jgi:hypothetical protein
MDGLDPAILKVAQESVAQRFGIAPTLAPRLRGDTLKALEDDAARLREDLGLGPLQERERGADGRFASSASGGMSAIIRRQAGYE